MAAISDQGIDPAQLGEAGEVRVGGADRNAVADRKRRQVSVGNEVAADVVALEQTQQNGCVIRRRGRDPSRRGADPGFDLIARSSR